MKKTKSTKKTACGKSRSLEDTFILQSFSCFFWRIKKGLDQVESLCDELDPLHRLANVKTSDFENAKRVLWNDSYFSKMKENSLTKKFAFTSKDLFKGNFLLNSKYFKEDMVSQTYLSMKCFPNSKTYFQQDFSLQITALFSRHGNITMILQAKHHVLIFFLK